MLAAARPLPRESVMRPQALVSGAPSSARIACVLGAASDCVVPPEVTGCGDAAGGGPTSKRLFWLKRLFLETSLVVAGPAARAFICWSCVVPRSLDCGGATLPLAGADACGSAGTVSPPGSVRTFCARRVG